MKIGVIQASSQTSKNTILFEFTKKNAKQHEVANFGCFESETENYSYVDISLQIGMLISSGAIDFIVTGCSSGQGMMLACNNLPDILCGYLPTPQDAYLFGRINNGNVASLPLGLNYGWAGEINLDYTLKALFSDDFGIGYPQSDANRKVKDAKLVRQIGQISKIPFLELLKHLDTDLIQKNIHRDIVTNYIFQNGTNKKLINYIKESL